MQKVITVTSKATFDQNVKFIETEYTEINKALKEGYIVSQVIPVIKPANSTSYYDTIFVLEKSTI